MSEPRVVVITGAAQRIGACIASTFHRHDYNVIVHYNQSEDAALQLVARLNGERPNSATALQSNLADAMQVENLSKVILDQFGRLDVLVNNASAFYSTAIGETNHQQWDDLIDTNLRAAFFLSQGLSHELTVREGAIINIVDTHADRPLQHHSVYSIAKAGLKAMTKSLALELAPGVRVLGVSPGAILWPASLENEDDPEVLQVRGKILQQIPLGHLGRPEDIADAVYFLANESSYMTGQVIRVDGGRHLA